MKRWASSRTAALAAAVLLAANASAGSGQEDAPAAASPAPPASPPGAVAAALEAAPLALGDCTGTGGAAIEVAGESLFLSLDELRRVQREVERFLAEEAPQVDASVIGPGEPFVDCWGTPRLGAWILESGHEPDELWATFRIHTSDLLIVRQIVTLARRGEAWRATGASQQISHRLRE